MKRSSKKPATNSSARLLSKRNYTFGPATRTAAGIAGLLILLNWMQAATGQADLNLWWIDLQCLPVWLAKASIFLLSVFLLLLTARRRLTASIRMTLLELIGLVIVVAGQNIWQVYQLATAGEVKIDCPLPFSLFVLLFWTGLFITIIRAKPIEPTQAKPGNIQAKPRWKRWGIPGIKVLATAGVLFLGIPLCQMACFGLSDYRRPADAAVIFGAGVYSDGKPSDALKDRLLAGIDLYKQGLVGKLVMSGGPGMGDVHETTAMKTFAAEHDVPRDDILLDPQGLSTRDTAYNTALLVRKHNWRHLLTVSHSYHLPRVKMTYQQQGLDVYTVPAPMQKPLARLPWYVSREIAALWAYYLKG